MNIFLITDIIVLMILIPSVLRVEVVVRISTSSSSQPYSYLWSESLMMDTKNSSDLIFSPSLSQIILGTSINRSMFSIASPKVRYSFRYTSSYFCVLKKLSICVIGFPFLVEMTSSIGFMEFDEKV